MEEEKNGTLNQIYWRDLARKKGEIMALLEDNPFTMYQVVDRNQNPIFILFSEPFGSTLVKKIQGKQSNSVPQELLDQINNIHRVVCENKGALQKVDNETTLNYEDSQ